MGRRAARSTAPPSPSFPNGSNTKILLTSQSSRCYTIFVRKCASPPRGSPKNPKTNLLSGDFHVHQSLQGPFLVVFVPLCRWPPVRRVIPSLPGAVRRSEGPAFRCCSGGSSDPPARWPRAPCVFPSAAIADSGLVGRGLL